MARGDFPKQCATWIIRQPWFKERLDAEMTAEELDAGFRTLLLHGWPLDEIGWKLWAVKRVEYDKAGINETARDRNVNQWTVLRWLTAWRKNKLRGILNFNSIKL